MKKGTLYAAPLMLALAGCSAAPEIVRFPADAHSAKLRYITTASRSDGTYLWHVDRSQCPGAATPMLIATTGDLERSQVNMIGSSSEAQALIRELNIPASEPLTFLVVALGGRTYSCDNAGVFRPLPGRQYELRYIVEPQTFVCIVQLDEIEQAPDGQVTKRREASAHYFHPPKKRPGYCAEAPRAN